MSNLIDIDDRDFVIELRVTERCNYDCEYCEFLHDNTSIDTYIDYKDVNKLIDMVREKYNKTVSINIYGGEPLLYKHISELLNGIYSDIKIEICTNLSFIIPELTNPNVHVCATWHSESVQFNTFLAKAIQIKSNIDMIPIMFYGGYDRDRYELLVKIFGNRVPMIAPIVLYDGDKCNTPYVLPVDETDHALQYSDFFKKHISIVGVEYSAYDMFKSYKNKLYGYSCECLKNKLSIDHNGNIFKCSMDMFHGFKHIDNLRTITDLQYYDVTCPHEYCMYDICESGKKWKL